MKTITKRIKVQPKYNRNANLDTISGKLTVTDKELKPGFIYEVTIKQIEE